MYVARCIVLLEMQCVCALLLLFVQMSLPLQLLRSHLNRHSEYCQAAEPARVVMPKKAEARRL